MDSQVELELKELTVKPVEELKPKRKSKKKKVVIHPEVEEEKKEEKKEEKITKILDFNLQEKINYVKERLKNCINDKTLEEKELKLVKKKKLKMTSKQMYLNQLKRYQLFYTDKLEDLL